LEQHLLTVDAATEAELGELTDEVTERVATTVTEAEKLGTMNSGPSLSAKHMFEHVYAEMPPHLRQQRQDLGV
jgi:2-oxoisovalerate dehydrogenase E1 component alpha subunit